MKADSKLGLILLCGLALTACNSGVGYSAAGDGQENLLSSDPAMNKVFIDQASAEDFDRHMVVCGNKNRPEACVVICHVPPGNPDARHTIRIGEAALDAHLKHGENAAHANRERDYLGECRDGSDDGGGGSGDGSGDSGGSSGGTDSGGSTGGSTDGSGSTGGSTDGSGSTGGSTDSGSGTVDNGSGSTDSGSGSTGGSTDGTGSTGGSTDGSGSTGGSTDGSGSTGGSTDGSNTGSGGSTAPVCTAYPITDRDQNCDGNDDVTGDALY